MVMTCARSHGTMQAGRVEHGCAQQEVWQESLRVTDFIVRAISKHLSQRGIWPKRHSWNKGLKKISKNYNKSWAPCVRAQKNALTLDSLSTLASGFFQIGSVPSCIFLLENYRESY